MPLRSPAPSHPSSHWRSALLATLLAIGLDGIARAAPYAMTYTGVIDDSPFSEIKNDESFTVTFVFDNGNSSANSQVWTAVHLTLHAPSGA